VRAHHIRAPPPLLATVPRIASALTDVHAVAKRSDVKEGKIVKRGRRVSSPPVSPVAGHGAEWTGDGKKTFEEKELARMQYNRQSATLSAVRRASKLSDLMLEQETLEAAYQARLAQVALLESIIGGARWAMIELPPIEV
jgi:hypothetical protein